MHRRIRLMLSRIASAVLCLCSGTGIAQMRAPLPWPPELPQTLLPKASVYVSEGSNALLDFHGSDQDPDLVIFTAGNQYRVFPELLQAFPDWVSTQSHSTELKVDRIFYATTPPGRLIDAMEA